MRPRVIKKSKYKGVSLIKSDGVEMWKMSLKIHGLNLFDKFDTEREAAKAYDLALIRHNKKPVNILKPK